MYEYQKTEHTKTLAIYGVMESLVHDVLHKANYPYGIIVRRSFGSVYGWLIVRVPFMGDNIYMDGLDEAFSDHFRIVRTAFSEETNQIYGLWRFNPRDFGLDLPNVSGLNEFTPDTFSVGFAKFCIRQSEDEMKFRVDLGDLMEKPKRKPVEDDPHLDDLLKRSKKIVDSFKPYGWKGYLLRLVGLACSAIFMFAHLNVGASDGSISVLQFLWTLIESGVVWMFAVDMLQNHMRGDE